MLPELVRRPMLGNNEGTFGDELEKEISLLLREQRRQEADDLEKELNLYRSGSAPPIVDGSLSAVGGLFNHGGAIGNGSPAFAEFSRSKNGNGLLSEEELRSDPAYLSYYYSNVNLNPRLPPPLLAKEDWRFTQKLHEGSSTIGDRRKVNKTDNGGGGRSMFFMPPGFNLRKQDNGSDSDKVQLSTEWGGDGLIGLSGLEIGRKQTMLAEILQDDLSHATSASEYLSRPSSRNAFGENADSLSLTEVDRAQLHCDLTSVDPVLSAAGIEGSPVVQNVGPPAAYSFAAALGASLSRSVTPDAQRTARAPSPCLTPIGEGRINSSEKRNTNSASSFSVVSDKVNKSTDLVAALSGINLSNGIINEENHLQSQVKQDVNDHNSYLSNISGGQTNTNQHLFLKGSESGQLHFPNVHRAAKVDMASVDRSDHRNSFFQGEMHRAFPSNKSSLKGFSNSTLSGGGLLSHHQHVDSANSSLLNYGASGCPMTPMSNHLSNYNLPHLFENGAAGSAMFSPDIDSRIFRGSNLSSFVPGENFNRLGNQTPGNLLQPSVMDPMYLQYLRTAEYAAALNESSVDRNYLGNSYMELIQKPYHGSLLSPQNSQYGVPMSGNGNGSTHHGYYGNPAFGVGLSYPGSPLASSVTPNSPAGHGSPMRQGEFNMRFPSGMRNLAGVIGPWHLDNMDNGYGSSLLEEFKNNKTKCFELSEIAGHVVEFSADQYGSRFIQQKLETATMEEKHMVFEEIMPQALTLMTDVFGNYVVQKFFEHGMTSQRRELASKLFGHVLTLSLQMYGCRVIQKAIEVVDSDQKIKMVEELDGHVMRCVRDQNGNHVIQKCIECVPEDHIQFIVSTFFDQVVTLSTHPYGCRVIQRVLEHCKDSKTQSKVMDELLGTVCSLAQDQYGNYVVQHVLQHGKPHERSAIIQELAGNIVQMSLQKFASNVVEKCLTFGDPTERQLLVNEMLGSTDENEPLQAMMKDQFANYVVQKVLETCNDQQRELILSRIKVHLTALKKYTYGKHIVVRVEKLVAAGERRIAAQSPNPA